MPPIRRLPLRSCTKSDYEAAMLRAAMKGDLEMVKRLIRKGVSVNFSIAELSHISTGKRTVHWASNDGALTFLHWASRTGLTNLVDLLIGGGAAINGTTYIGGTALHFAVAGGSMEVLQLLLKKEGIDLNHQDRAGDTPLHWAYDCNRREMVKLLLEAGSDCFIENRKGEIAIDLSDERPSLEEIRLYFKHGLYFDDEEYDTHPMKMVLKDVDICTLQIVNKFHQESLEALYSNPLYARSLPPKEKMKLSGPQIREVEKFVEDEIEKKTFCNVKKARPMVLQMMCVQSLTRQA